MGLLAVGLALLTAGAFYASTLNVLGLAGGGLGLGVNVLRARPPHR
ncbi:MAG: hypothetical protein ACLSGS_07905 [Adlercreutzia sp.]